MKHANCAFVIAIVFAMGSGSAVAEEQTVPSKSAPQPTVMSDAQLDQIVGGSVDVFGKVADAMDNVSNPDTVIHVLTTIGNNVPSGE